MLFGSLAKIYFRKWRFEFFKIFSKPIKKKNIFLYYYGQVFKRHGIDKKNNKKSNKKNENNII